VAKFKITARSSNLSFTSCIGCWENARAKSNLLVIEEKLTGELVESAAGWRFDTIIYCACLLPGFRLLTAPEVKTFVRINAKVTRPTLIYEIDHNNNEWQ
jgi:hypothetical protein